MPFQKKEDWIIPPGLVPKAKEFEKHCRIAINRSMPVLIHGSTGSGKSFFLRIYEEEYSIINKEIKKVIRLNCSHFAGADPRIAQTELFGAKKGAASGIPKDKTGLIHVANEGLLVLDEIGELPKEVQAMLLTYIETGEFRKLGGMENETSSAFIVAATNRPEELRRDFYNRFFPFRIPSLNERRGDVLYYFAYSYPELVCELTPHIILSLLSYHWPGNVREIERMGLLITKNKEDEDTARHKSSRGNDIDDATSSFVNNIINMVGFKSAMDELEEENDNDRTLYESLPIRRGIINKNRLESILNTYNISLDASAMRYPFSDFQSDALETTEYSKFKIVSKYHPFEKAWTGYKVFCALFLQDEKQNRNSMRMRQFTIDMPQLSKVELRTLKKISKGMGLDIIKTLANLGEIDVDNRMKDIAYDDSRRSCFQGLYERNPRNPFLNLLMGGTREHVQAAHDIDLTGFKQDELLNSYYRQVLKKVGGVTRAAKEVGIPASTFRDKLKDFGIEVGRKNKT